VAKSRLGHLEAMAGREHMERFWDARAREDPWFFVDNRMPYRGADLERFWAEGARDLDRLLDALGARVQPGDTVVEVGCGVGRLARALAPRARQVIALDVSGEMLALAREHNPRLANVRWLHGDGTTLHPIADASADACLSHVVFQHLPDPAITLGYVREMGRVLRPGGWAAFQLSTDPALHRRPRRRPSHRLRALVGRAPRGVADPAWVGAAVEMDALAATAASAGLRLERVVGAGTQFCAVLARRV